MLSTFSISTKTTHEIKLWKLSFFLDFHSFQANDGVTVSLNDSFFVGGKNLMYLLKVWHFYTQHVCGTRRIYNGAFVNTSMT